MTAQRPEGIKSLRKRQDVPGFALVLHSPGEARREQTHHKPYRRRASQPVSNDGTSNERKKQSNAKKNRHGRPLSKRLTIRPGKLACENRLVYRKARISEQGLDKYKEVEFTDRELPSKQMLSTEPEPHQQTHVTQKTTVNTCCMIGRDEQHLC